MLALDRPATRNQTLHDDVRTNMRQRPEHRHDTSVTPPRPWLTRRRAPRAVALAVLTATVAACGSGDAEPEAEPGDEPPASELSIPELPANPNVVALQLERIDNQPDPLFRWRDAVDFTLTSGGQVFAADPDAPYQPVTRLLTATVSPEGVAELLDRARAAGLYDPLDGYGTSRLADGTTTVFRTADGNELAIYDLDADPDSRDATDDQLDALERLEAFENDLLAWTTTMGDWFVQDLAPYRPERVIVLSTPLLPPPSDDDLELLDGAVDVGTDLECAELSGAELDAVWPRLSDPATEISREIAVRPLVIGEPGCDDIDGN